MPNPTRTSPDGVQRIRGREGFVGHVYKDGAGVDTIAFGHVWEPGDPTTMTEAEGVVLLAEDLGRFERAVSSDVQVPLTQCQYDALVSFTYNAGTGALAESTTLKLLNDSKYTQAAAALQMWCKRRDPRTGALVEDPGLLARRKAEQAQFLEDGAAAAGDNPYDLGNS